MPAAMNPNDLPQDALIAANDGADLLAPLLQSALTSEPALADASSAPLHSPVHGVITGTLLALTDKGQTALVSFAGQPGHAALRARSVVDLHGPHMGQSVVLMFEGGDVHKPIVMGLLRGQTPWPLPDQPATVDVDADGQRMIVSAKEQLVLRCGKASITLTKAGKVLIEGSYVASTSSGVNRLKGGSVQLN
jgi:hypothetical protein